MTTNYIKTEVGNKLFTIEWNFPLDPMNAVEGQKFEAINCELISMFGMTPSGIESRVMISNFSDPDNFRTFKIVEEVYVSPPIASGNPQLLPPMRWYWPMLLEGSGNANIAFLFREI